MKDPTSCNNSVCFGGIYICKLHTLPCERCNNCPMENNLIKAMEKCLSEAANKKKTQ